MRVYSDDRFAIGDRLELDVLLPTGTLRCWVEVVWTRDLGAEEPATFDVGLKFVDVADGEIQRLAAALGAE